MQFDLVLHQGRVLDPSQNLDDCLDVGIRGSRIKALSEAIAPAESACNVDCRGKIVVPGLIDLHTHVYDGGSTYGIDADTTCLRRGVTTVVDCGTAGSANWGDFAKYALRLERTRIFAFIHISAIGLIYSPVGELLNLDYVDAEGAARIVRQNPGRVLGVKVRLGEMQVGKDCVTPLKYAKAAAAQAGSAPVMVHISGLAGPLKPVLGILEPGDIVTHCFTGNPPLVVDKDYRVLPEVFEAAGRGVIFDVGHGVGSFSFAVCQAALEQGLVPTTISTDLHTFSLPGPVYDFTTTMSKFLAMGMPLEEVVAKCTHAPAKVIGREDLGTLRVGAEADVTVLELREGYYTFCDTVGGTLCGTRMLEPLVTVKGGQVVS